MEKGYFELFGDRKTSTKNTVYYNRKNDLSEEDIKRGYTVFRNKEYDIIPFEEINEYLEKNKNVCLFRSEINTIPEEFRKEIKEENITENDIW